MYWPPTVCPALGEMPDKKVSYPLTRTPVGQSKQGRRTKQDLIMDVNSDVTYNEGLFVEHRKISEKAIWGKIINVG